MKLLGTGADSLDLEQLIRAQVQADYVYMYPPRQAYHAIEPTALAERVRLSLEGTRLDPVNIYVHFPFCRQICGFCNLYSVPVNRTDELSDYTDLIAREINQWAPLIKNRPVATVYLGGGTPSILPPAELDRCLRDLERALGFSRSGVAEVALEVAPDTVDQAKLRELSSIGINRINLGLQTTSDEGLHQIGRRHGFALARQRIEEALSAGFTNVCVDLIYGLPGQTVGQWRGIVEDVLLLKVPTVCAYPLTLRPSTGFSRRGVTVDGADQYTKYDIALDLFRAAGYEQETHVRYVIPERGGYQQKRNHWAGQDVIGVGAGARGYLRCCDYRNGYSIRRRREALETYRSRVLAGQTPITSGYCIDRDERMRRRVILGLFELDLRQFRPEFSIDARAAFADEFAVLTRLDLIETAEDRARLTTRGRRYRDIVVQLFFSAQVWKRIQDFDYAE